jgi:site-specific recombinase XerD
MSGTTHPLRPTTVEEAAQAFFGHSTIGGRPKEAEAVASSATRLHSMGRQQVTASLGTHEIEGFLSHWIGAFETRNKREPSDHSIKNVIVALRSLYKYLNDYGLLLDEGRSVRNPMLPIQPPTPDPKVNDWLRRSEDEALLSAFFKD